MSVDEVAWQKWHKYVPNVVDVEKRKIIWNQQARGKSTADTFFLILEKENCGKIKTLANDGAKGYLLSIGHYAKNAMIVLDRFHIPSPLMGSVRVGGEKISLMTRTSRMASLKTGSVGLF